MSVIDTLFTGRAAPLSRNGLQGDEQGDPVYHGGPEKAVHHYAVEDWV